MKYKYLIILPSGGNHFKLRLWNLDSGLLIKGKAVKYRNGFLESCKNIQILKVMKEVIRENWE